MPFLHKAFDWQKSHKSWVSKMPPCGPNYLNATQNLKPTYTYIWPLQCFGTLHLSYNHEQHLKSLKSNCQMNGVNLKWHQTKSQGKRFIFSHWIGCGEPPQPAVSLSSMPWCQMQGSACSVCDSANSSHQKNIQNLETGESVACGAKLAFHDPKFPNFVCQTS